MRTHHYLVSAAEELGQALPKNTGREFGARLLDRAVIETVHTLREYSKTPDGAPLTLPLYDTMRSPFQEGNALYDGAGFQAKNHIQIAVRNLACIKGYFKPMV